MVFTEQPRLRSREKIEIPAPHTLFGHFTLVVLLKALLFRF